MILDEVVRDLNARQRADYLPSFKSATVLKIQNVADYRILAESEKKFELTELPTCIPPWPITWVEFQLHQFILKGPDKEKQAAESPKSFRIEHIGESVSIKLPYPTKIGILVRVEDAGTAADNIKWVMYMDYFQSGRGEVGHSKFYLHSDGTISDSNQEIQSLREYALYEEDTIFIIFAEIACIAFSFCHCKNCTIKPNAISHALIRKRTKSDKVPVTRFYTLEISPMRKLLDDVIQRDTVGLSRALHICRGHFKDYRESAGLFGKYKGLYWWDAAIRGDAKSGSVDKDYVLKDSIIKRRT